MEDKESGIDDTSSQPIDMMDMAKDINLSIIDGLEDVCIAYDMDEQECKEFVTTTGCMLLTSLLKMFGEEGVSFEFNGGEFNASLTMNKKLH